MAIPIFFNSNDGINNSKVHDFTITFEPAFKMEKNTRYSVALDSIGLSYS